MLNGKDILKEIQSLQGMIRNYENMQSEKREYQDEIDDMKLQIEAYEFVLDNESEKEYFEVSMLHRDDLKICLDTMNKDTTEAKRINAIIDSLEDSEMERIAELMSDGVNMDAYWLSLRLAMEDNDEMKSVIHSMKGE